MVVNTAGQCFVRVSKKWNFNGFARIDTTFLNEGVSPSAASNPQAEQQPVQQLIKNGILHPQLKTLRQKEDWSKREEAEREAKLNPIMAPICGILP